MNTMETETPSRPKETDDPRWWLLAATFSTGFFAGTIVILWIGMMMLGLHWAALPHFAVSAE